MQSWLNPPAAASHNQSAVVGIPSRARDNRPNRSTPTATICLGHDTRTSATDRPTMRILTLLWFLLLLNQLKFRSRFSGCARILSRVCSLLYDYFTFIHAINMFVKSRIKKCKQEKLLLVRWKSIVILIKINFVRNKFNFRTNKLKKNYLKKVLHNPARCSLTNPSSKCVIIFVPLPLSRGIVEGSSVVTHSV